MPDWSFLIAAGVLLIILGFFLIAFGMMRSKSEDGGPDQENREEKIKGGGVILIGPIPVVFGTDKRFVLIAMILAIVIMMLAIMLLKWR
jgi:uncharacterized protein (TIGR00304 family)